MKRLFAVLLALALALGAFTLAGGNASAESAAPVAENMEFCTYRNVSFGGQLKAYSTDSEALRFELCTEPVKGSIALEEDGSFVYTPKQNKKGRDYFGYKAVDSQGRYSQEATVIIRIEKQKQNLSYADMAGRGEEYAAVVLSELGIFTGERLGGSYRFEPDSAVTRGEFIAMCMQLCTGETLSSALSTGYCDDEDIPLWLKPYAVSAP